MKNPNNIEVGDVVRLNSTWPRKCGIVQALVPAGESVLALIPAGALKSSIKIDKDKSARDRVLVLVKKVLYYAPLVSTCKKLPKCAHGEDVD